MAKHIAGMRKGASAIGYGLVVGLISVVALGAITQVGQQGEALFSGVGGTLDDVVTENVSFPSPAASPSPSASPSAEHVYWNCPSAPNKLVFAQNVQGISVNSYQSHIDACKAYGFKAAGTSYTGNKADQGWGTTDNADLLEATHCYNCFWEDRGNPFYKQNGGAADCTHIQGTAPAEAILAGVIVNTATSALNCATFKQEVNGTTALTDLSSDSNNPFYFSDYSNFGDEPNCLGRANHSSGEIAFTGVADYLLCASATVP